MAECEAVYLASVIASVVQGPHKLHHVAHSVLWARIKHVDFWVVEGVARVSHGIPRLPCADGDESITACSSNNIRLKYDDANRIKDSCT